MNRIRVCIADDDQRLRTALAELVRSEPSFELVDVAADGRDAVEAATRLRPDVMLMDVRMPRLDGIEATRRIRAATGDVKVVGLSAHADCGTVLEMLRCGAVGYLVKDSPPGDVLEAVRRAAAGHGALSPRVSAEVVGALASRLEQEERAASACRERVDRVRRAIQGRRRSVYQPIVDLRTGRVVAVEALTRFNLPPVQSPEAWFADATEAGLRTELEHATLVSALEHASQLPPGVQLWVNAGPEALLSGRLHGPLLEARVGLVVELTEHARIEDYAALTAALAPLRDRGVGLAVDDVGAGFSSLRHVLQVAPDHVKLDRSLTCGLASDPARAALAAAMISFAAEVGATVVAEGVEEPTVVASLRVAGVRYAQGFHLARPAPLRALRLDVSPAGVA